MLLLVARLLLVYGATAALSLYLARRFVRPISLRVALFLACAPALLTGKALLTGGVQAPLGITYDAPPLSAYRAEIGVGRTRSPILSDVVASYIPWRKAVREAIQNGRLPLWNRFELAGDPLLAVQEPAVLHPATWIGLLLPLAQAWTFEMALRSFLALLAAYLFFRELRCGELVSCLGAAGWAFSSYLVFYLGFPLSPATAPFPLLLLGLRRLADEKERYGLAITVAALLLITTAGHPETLLHSVAGAGVYFLFELGFAGRGRRLRPVLRSLLAGTLALGFSAVLILPFAEVLPHTREHELRSGWYAKIDKSVPLRQNVRLTVQNAMPYAFGVSGRSKLVPGFGEPAAYAGSLLFPFALVGIFSGRREKWPFLVLAFLGLALWARVDGITDAIYSLPLFDIAINQRLVFLATFALVALAVLGAEQIADRKRIALFVGGAVASLAVLSLLYWHYRPKLLDLDMPAGYLRDRFLIQIVPLAILAVFVPLWRTMSHRILALTLILLLAQRQLESGSVYKTHPPRAFFPPLDFLEKIPRGEPYRITPLGYTFLPNIPTLYGLEDVRGYPSMTLARLAQTFPFWCETDPIWWNRVEDPTDPFLSFLNVRYFIGPPGSAAHAGWRVLARSRGGILFENPDVLPRAFAPRHLFYEKDPWTQLQMVKSNPNFGTYGIVDAIPEKGGSRFTRNGGAKVRISSYTGQEMTLEIEATESAIIATSITRWPGWKLKLDGRKVALIPCNWAFWAFRVPRGHHEAVLRYLPDGFLYGLAVSVLTAFGSAAFPLARRRRRARELPVDVPAAIEMPGQSTAAPAA